MFIFGPMSQHADEVVQASDLPVVPLPVLAAAIVPYAVEVYVEQKASTDLTPWAPDLINAFMESYMDYVEGNGKDLEDAIHDDLALRAHTEQWDSTKKLTTAVALGREALPLLRECAQRSAETSQDGTFHWQMPVPTNRQVDIPPMFANWQFDQVSTMHLITLLSGHTFRPSHS